MKRTSIRPEGGPPAIGPYSPAVEAGGWIWVSGQIGIDPASGQLVQGGVGAEIRQALANLRELLAAAGTDLAAVVRVTLWLTSMDDFDEVNRIYAEYFSNEPPARVTVAVAGLPKGARIEVDAIALSARPS